MNKKDRKSRWRRPKLFVLLRVYREERVLSACKYTSESGPESSQWGGDCEDVNAGSCDAISGS